MESYCEINFMRYLLTALLFLPALVFAKSFTRSKTVRWLMLTRLTRTLMR